MQDKRVFSHSIVERLACLVVDFLAPAEADLA
jgi:hypothetical protein